MSKVVVIGSANMGLTLRLRRLVQLGDAVSAGEFYASFGGSRFTSHQRGNHESNHTASETGNSFVVPIPLF